MAEEQPSLHIDTDWKKQAQEEKRRLAEEEEKRRAQSATNPFVGSGAEALPIGEASAVSAESGIGARAATADVVGGARNASELPPPSFATVVQAMLTQALFYLGDLAPRGREPMLNLDMAKHQIDSLGVLEMKTAGNLTDDEKRLLDTALYEARMRYVAVASQLIS